MIEINKIRKKIVEGKKRIRTREYKYEFTQNYLHKLFNDDSTKKGIVKDCDYLKIKLYDYLKDDLDENNSIKLKSIIRNSSSFFSSNENNDVFEEIIRTAIEERTGIKPSATINEGMIGKIYGAITSNIKDWPISSYFVPFRKVFLPKNLTNAVYVAVCTHELGHDVDLNEPAATLLANDVCLEMEQKFPNNDFEKLSTLWAYHSAASTLYRIYGENHFEKDIQKQEFILGTRKHNGFVKPEHISSKYTMDAYLLAKELIKQS